VSKQGTRQKPSSRTPRNKVRPAGTGDASKSLNHSLVDEVTAAKPWRSLFHWYFAILLAVIVFFSAIRWRLADMPLERDEGEYAYAGQLILQGIPPYQLAYNMKLPGTYAAYAAILATLGQTPHAIRLGFLAVNVISVLLLYVLVSRLFGTLAGIMAGASYAFLSTHQSVLGFAAHATHFVVLPALIGLILMLRAAETRRPAHFFWSGIAFGIAFVMKQPGIFFAAFALLYLAIQCWPQNKDQWMPWAKDLGIFFVGGALPFALTCILLFRAGVFHNFWFWTFSYASRYATAVSLDQGWHEFSKGSSVLLNSSPWLWALALIGISAPVWNRTARRHAFLLIGLLVFSFAAVCPGLYFRHHYFVVMLPAVAILIAVAVFAALELLTAKFSSPWVRVLPIIVFAAAWGLSIYHNRDVYFKLTPGQACQFFYGGNPFPSVDQAAAYLRDRTTPADTVMVFGSEPEIYFAAQRHSASGYIYMYPLLEDQSYWEVMQKQMEHEVVANSPAYVVFVNVRFSWLGDPESPRTTGLVKWMNDYLARNFDRVLTIEQREVLPGEPVPNEKTRQHSEPTMLIFKRKA
jgi:4-amino-4-deoxy-L-arabinose transferase-like glycosyltransferase